MGKGSRIVGLEADARVRDLNLLVCWNVVEIVAANAAVVSPGGAVAEAVNHF